MLPVGDMVGHTEDACLAVAMPLAWSITMGDYFLDKNYFLEESDYLNGKLPDKISSKK